MRRGPGGHDTGDFGLASAMIMPPESPRDSAAHLATPRRNTLQLIMNTDHAQPVLSRGTPNLAEADPRSARTARTPNRAVPHRRPSGTHTLIPVPYLTTDAGTPTGPTKMIL